MAAEAAERDRAAGASSRSIPYYTKFTWAREFTVVGRGASDEALLKANDTIRNMFAYRHDILKALIADGVKLVVLGRGRKDCRPARIQVAGRQIVDRLDRRDATGLHAGH